MSESDGIQTARDGVALVGELIKAAGDNPNVHAAGNELGKTALTITTAINNCLLPVAAVNFAFQKARHYFEKTFPSDLSRVAKDIPPESVIEPKASIAGPAMQALAFSHEEPNLKEMYLNLLASAMDGRIADKAHPGFVEIIRQLQSTEARLLQDLLARVAGVPIVEIRLKIDGQGNWITLYRHLLSVQENGEDKEDLSVPAMVDNWVRLGLMDVEYGKHLVKVGSYDPYAWVLNRPEYVRFKGERENEKDKVVFERGIIWPTAFGQLFWSVVVAPVRAVESPEVKVPTT